MFVVTGLGYMREYPYERVLRDSRILLIFEVSYERKIKMKSGFVVNGKLSVHVVSLCLTGLS